MITHLRANTPSGRITEEEQEALEAAGLRE